MEKKRILDWLKARDVLDRQGLKGLSHIVVVIDLIAPDSESLGDTMVLKLDLRCY